MLEPLKIDHVCLLVRNLKQAKTYYETLFDTSCRFRNDDPTTLIFETPNVHFFLSESTADPSFLSEQHLSFQVSNLEEVMSKLKAINIGEYTTGMVDFFEYSNYKWCEWRDPDGIRLECVELIL